MDEKKGLGGCETPAPSKAISDKQPAPYGAIADKSQPSFSLRPYQVDGVEKSRAAYAGGAQSVVYVLPTGGGKTAVFVFIVENAVKLGRRVLILAHRQEIFDQVAGALTIAGVPYGVIAPGSPETDAPVQIASVASLARARRLNRWRDWFDFIVVDECHHAVAGSWTRVLASQPGAKILGVTATPERLDGMGLRKRFGRMVVGPQTAELTEAGYLCGFTVFEPVAGGPDMSGARMRAGEFAIEDTRAAMGGVVIGAAVEEKKRICPGVPTVAFCIDVDHSKAVAERFHDAGIKAAHVDGDTPSAERRAAIAALGGDGLEVLCNCGLISEGVDVPALGAALLLRPTASLALYLQQVGRALRPAPGKDRALILDFSGNVARHGLPDAPREWSLDAKPRRQRERAEGPRLRRCPSCACLNLPSAHSCVECGADLRTARERAEIEVALREAKQRELEDMLARMRPFERIAWAGADERRLHLVARVQATREVGFTTRSERPSNA